MYITGSLGVAWAFIWLLVVYPSPDQANIGDEERRLLREQVEAAQNRTGQSQSKKPGATECENHRTISLMSHTLKLLLKILLTRI
ncbi:vesicular glutamate transporter 2 [Elysia marginata]|uniref:Vesicular glutamate transporter 2 n=1 Tax=Elysia marginata TaxID=1093978 RepID=A0AAV4FGI7_9GAST|nr:vesicular glutamate transporter 2 [Elysia marginata]